MWVLLVYNQLSLVTRDPVNAVTDRKTESVQEFRMGVGEFIKELKEKIFIR